MLTPRSLRQAQGKFRETIPLIGKIVSLQGKLSSLEHSYNKLLEQKSMLEENLNKESGSESK